MRQAEQWKRARKALQALASAPDVYSLLEAGDSMLPVLSLLAGLASTGQAPKSSDKQQLQQMLSVQYQAFSNAIRCVNSPSLTMNSTDNAFRLLADLAACAVCMVGLWLNGVPDTAAAQDQQLLVSKTMAETGFVRALIAACSIASTHQQQGVQSRAPLFTKCILNTIGHVAKLWPQKRLSGTVFPAVWLPAARLALLKARSHSVAAALAQVDQPEYFRTTIATTDTEHIFLADLLITYINNEVLMVDPVLQRSWPEEVQEILRSQDVLHLCLVHLACHVKQLHAERHGRSAAGCWTAARPSSKQLGKQKQRHLRVAASHDQLLAVLGAGHCSCPVKANVQDIFHDMAVVGQLVQFNTDAASTCSDSSTSSSNSRVQQGPLSIPLYNALMLTLVEMQLLEPTPKVQAQALAAMCTICSTMRRAVGVLAIAGDAASVLEPLLVHGVAAVHHARPAAGGAADERFWPRALQLFGTVVLIICHLVTPHDLAAILQKEPAACAAALETAIRSVPTPADAGVLHAQVLGRILDACSVSLSGQVHVLPATHVQPNSRSSSRQDGGLQGQQKKLESAELSTLLFTVPMAILKVAHRSIVQPNDWYLSAAVAAAAATPGLYVASGLTSMASQSSTSAASASAGTVATCSSSNAASLLPVLLAGRSLMVTALSIERLLEVRAQPGQNLSDCVSVAMIELHGRCCTNLELCGKVFQQLLSSAGSMTAVLQPLLQHCSDIQQQLMKFQPVQLEGSKQQLLTEVCRIYPTEVLQQLQQLGAEVCAALPVPNCCNNPSCVNLAKLSEQQLVAGKGSVCAGCYTARYCGAACQKAHWKMHKAACRRIKGAKTSRT